MKSNRGGFSPCQLVLGINPRLPHELLSDDVMDDPNANADDIDVPPESAQGAFRKSEQVRIMAK